MKMKHLICVMLAFLLVFMVTVSPTLAADDTKDEITILKGGEVKDSDQEEDNTDTTSDTDDVMDTIISDDKILGYDRNEDYDITQDISIQTAIDLASSLPPWKLFAAIIMLLSVIVLVTYVVVIQWNLFKGGKAATNENPQKAAQGIRDSKLINRSYTEEVIEGALFIGGIVFLVLLLS